MTWGCCGTAGWDGCSRRLCALDVGLVPAFVPVRPRPAAGRSRRQVLDRAGGRAPLIDSGDAGGGVGRCRRHHHRGPRVRQAGRRVRLLGGPRLERAAGHRRHHRSRRWSWPSGSARARAGRRAARNGWSPTPSRPLVGADRAGRCCCGPTRRSTGRHRRRRHPGRRRGVGHGPDEPAGQGRHRGIAEGRGPRSSTPTPSTTRPPAAGSPGPRWPRSPFIAFASKKAPNRSRPAGGPPHPGTEPERHERPGPTVRHVAVPRLLHHQRSLDTVAADKTHRGHAIIEQVHADLKNSALAHLPSGTFNANAAWLVLAVIAFNLTRAAAALTGPRAGQGDHRHHPPQAHRGSRPDRHLGPTRHAAPAKRLALGNRLDPAVRPRQRATSRRHALTTQPTRRDHNTAWNTRAARPGTQPRQQQHGTQSRPAKTHHPASVDRG